MRIAYDAKRAFLNATGLGNYSRSLITAMSGHYKADEYHLYTPSKKFIPQAATLFGLPNVSVHYPRSTFFTSYWRSKSIVKDLLKDNIALYHGLSHEIPLGIEHTRIKSVVSIHDLIFLRYPQFYPAIDRKIYETKIRHACLHADHIIAISNQTKNDILKYFNMDEQKVSVVYQGCNPGFYNKVSDSVKEKIRNELQLPEKYILNVGTIEERKNALLIVQALKYIPESIKLVLLGKQKPYAEKIKSFLKENNLSSRVVFIENMPQEYLPALFQMAAVFVYPSRFEGFGIPVLEALNSRVPVVAATGSSLEEAGGAHSIYIPPDDVTALADAIQNILTYEQLRHSMIENGHEYALRFREEKMAANMMHVYSRIMSL